MNKAGNYRLLERSGIELEYAIVSREDGRVLPLADRLLKLPGGGIANCQRMGPCIVSNELALHVIELKTPEPIPCLCILMQPTKVFSYKKFYQSARMVITSFYSP